MRLIDADDIAYESIDSSDTTRYEDYYGTGIFAVRKEDIDAMPTIEPERKKGEWIPVSERLPEEDVYVLLCDGEDDESYDSGAYSRIAVGLLEDGMFRCWDDSTHMSEIVAWMPLPEPYKGDTND